MNESIEVIEPGRSTLLTERGQRFDLWHEVPLVPQTSGMSCWAAAAAMLIGWRDRIYVEGPEVAQGAGRWQEFSAGLHPRDITDLARIWHLTPIPEQDHRVEALYRLLTRYGPLWLGEAVPGLHVVVIVGMYGDGTSEGTWVRINDPWPVGRGERYRLRFDELMQNYRRAGRLAGLHAQLLHCGGRSAGTSVQMEQSWRASMTVQTERSGTAAPGPAQPRVEDNGPVGGDRIEVLEPGGDRETTVASALSTAWAEDVQSIDYRHLGIPGLSQAFDFDSVKLARLCTLNRFDVSSADLVLFGLRGCMVVEGGNGAFRTSVRLSEHEPNHRDRRCVLGVWSRGSNRIAVFEGSTVPSLGSVRRQKNNRRSWNIANLLPTGRYTYRVGTHNGSRRVPGALLQNGPVVVLRTFDNLVYETTDSWHLHHPADNIHPAFLANGFSSAGCNTVKGTYQGGHRGPWRDFRRRAGLSDGQTSAAGRFVYVLLTGREARLAASMRPTDTRLRFGSSGSGVSALQRALQGRGLLEPTGGGWQLPNAQFRSARNGQTSRTQFPPDADGQMRGHTTLAWTLWQQRNQSGQADGIVTPTQQQRLRSNQARGSALQQGATTSGHPWSHYFHFPAGTRFRVDGPLSYNGTGRVLINAGNRLKFTMDMPAVEIFGYSVPAMALVIDVTYRQEGAGNSAVITVNGTQTTDSNLRITSSGRRRTLRPSVSVPGVQLGRIEVGYDGRDEIDLDIEIDGTMRDFDLERIR
jgi:hypothetical protein